VIKRASAIRQAGRWHDADAIDCVLLDANERHRRRVVLKSQCGTSVLLDLPHPVMLHHGDALVLDDGTMVRVDAKPEPLCEIAAEEGADLARIAWHIGNRHIEMQIIGDRLRIRRDHVIEAMLIRLGARLTPIEAPFEPEHGAYDVHDEQGHHHEP
jgi:urease accessory protein